MMSKEDEHVKNLFFDLFRKSGCATGQGFTFNRFLSFTHQLGNTERKVLLEQTLPEMETEGYFTYDERNGFFKLTEKGYDYIYQNMRTEYEVANMILDVFRKAKRGSGEIIRSMTIFEIANNDLNPREKGLFTYVLNKLMQKGYLSMTTDRVFFKLEELGSDYLYGGGEIDLTAPIDLIGKDDINSEAIFNRMWDIIGPDKKAPKQMSGPEFYKIILKLKKDLPYSLTQYIGERRDKGQSISRIDYYHDLIQTLSPEQKEQFYRMVEAWINNPGIPQPTPDESKIADFEWEIPTHKTVNKHTGAILQKQEPAAIGHEQEDSDDENMLKVGISYTVDQKNKPELAVWVKDLADKLTRDGVHVILDQYDLRLGGNKNLFMEHMMYESDRVILIATPRYKEKADSRIDGAGYEYTCLTNQLIENLGTEKFIPVLREGTFDTALPRSISQAFGIDMTNDNEFDERYDALLRELYKEHKVQRPPRGKKPDFK